MRKFHIESDLSSHNEWRNHTWIKKEIFNKINTFFDGTGIWKFAKFFDRIHDHLIKWTFFYCLQLTPVNFVFKCTFMKFLVGSKAFNEDINLKFDVVGNIRSITILFHHTYYEIVGNIVDQLKIYILNCTVPLIKFEDWRQVDPFFVETHVEIGDGCVVILEKMGAVRLLHWMFSKTYCSSRKIKSYNQTPNDKRS
jgi:hypothetical protein